MELTLCHILRQRSATVSVSPESACHITARPSIAKRFGGIEERLPGSHEGNGISRTLSVRLVLSIYNTKCLSNTQPLFNLMIRVYRQRIPLERLGENDIFLV